MVEFDDDRLTDEVAGCVRVCNGYCAETLQGKGFTRLLKRGVLVHVVV